MIRTWVRKFESMGLTLNLKPEVRPRSNCKRSCDIYTAQLPFISKEISWTRHMEGYFGQQQNDHPLTIRNQLGRRCDTRFSFKLVHLGRLFCYRLGWLQRINCLRGCPLLTFGRLTPTHFNDVRFIVGLSPTYVHLLGDYLKRHRQALSGGLR